MAHTCEDECSQCVQCRKINIFLRHFPQAHICTPRSEHVYGRAREAGLRSEAALRALGDDRDMTEEQLAPLARVHGDAADRAVVDGRRGHGRSLEKVPGKLGHVERGAPEAIVEVPAGAAAIRTLAATPALGWAHRGSCSRA